MSAYRSRNPQSDGSNDMSQIPCACYRNRPEGLQYATYEYACIVHSQQDQQPSNLPALRRGRSLVFGMDRPEDWDDLDSTARHIRRREVLTKLIGTHHLWFEEDNILVRYESKITVWRNDYYGSFELVEHDELEEYLRIGHTFIRALATMTLENINSLSARDRKYFNEALKEREAFWQAWIRRPLKMAIYGRVQPSAISSAEVQLVLRNIDGGYELPHAYTDRVVRLCRTRSHLQPQPLPIGSGSSNTSFVVSTLPTAPSNDNALSVISSLPTTPTASRTADAAALYPPAAQRDWVTGPHLPYDKNGTASIAGLPSNMPQMPGQVVHRAPTIIIPKEPRNEYAEPVAFRPGQPPNAPARQIRSVVQPSPSPGPAQPPRQPLPTMAARMSIEAAEATATLRANSPPPPPQQFRRWTPAPSPQRRSSTPVLQQSRSVTPMSGVRMITEVNAAAAARVNQVRSSSPLIATSDVPRQDSSSSSSGSRGSTPSQRSQHDGNVAWANGLFPERASLSRSASPALWKDESNGSEIRRDPFTGHLMLGE